MSNLWYENKDGDIVRKPMDEKINPKVGIFWIIDEEMVLDAVMAADAEPYGNAMQYGGHYEFWDKLIPKTKTDRFLKAKPYEFYPRGRVVYFRNRDIFCLYTDPCISNDEIEIICNAFDLNGVDIEFKGDDHYRCGRCNPHYFE